MDASILFDSDGETVTRAATAALTRRGLYVVRSFDLRSAMAAHAGCECPHHGTAQCTCQFVVLLVYGDPSTREAFGSAQDRVSGDAPVVVTAHSRDVQAQVQIVRPTGMLRDDANSRPDPRLVEQVMAALFEAALTVQAVLPSPAEVPADAHPEA